MTQATVNSGLNIPGLYRSVPTGYQATVNGQNGPTPGALRVTTAGLNVDLSELTAMGGLCWIANYGSIVGDVDPSHRVDWGIWYTAEARFFPLGSLLPGEFTVIRLSPELGYDEPETTGTGTGNIASRLRLRANTVTCQCRVDAFDP